MQKMKITEEDLLTILNEFLSAKWKYSYPSADIRIVGISKPINENGTYVYDLTLKDRSL